jgi:hypothetical protein
MKETLGAVVGAIFAFLITVRICAYMNVDVVLGLFCWASSPIIGAIIGVLCFRRICWDKKYVVLIARSAAAGALLFGIINLIFQIDTGFRSPLTDFTNSLARFLTGAFIGGALGICVGGILFRHTDSNNSEKIEQERVQPTDEIWPPAPKS